MMSLIAAKSDYIIKADQVYENLQECEECFSYEAAVLRRFRCMLARREEIRDYDTEGIRVRVFQISGGYELHYLNYQMSVSVYEDMIVDFTLQIR